MLHASGVSCYIISINTLLILLGTQQRAFGVHEWDLTVIEASSAHQSIVSDIYIF